MGRSLSWLANAALFVFCCSLVADTANAVFAALLNPGSAPAVARNQPPPRSRSWEDRQVILSRNLFNASTLAPTVEFPVAEDLEATRLPLKLHATAASNDSSQSLAIVEDLESGESTVVRVGGDLSKGKATVLLIERKRVVLTENGTTRELTFDEAEHAGSARPARSRTSRSSSRSRSRSSRLARRSPRAGPQLDAIRPLAKDRFAVAPGTVEDLVRDPSSLLGQADFVPEFEDGQMVGVKIRKPKPGSLFEQLGIQDGDVIVEFNGIPMDSPQQTARIMEELAADKPATIGLAGGRIVNLVPQE